MSREWVDDRKKKPVDKRWVMRCDVGLFSSTRERCATESEPCVKQPELWQFAAQGWLISARYSDVCPVCAAEGATLTSEPHRVMERAAMLA